ncbi:MAG: hemin ABC transporter substrate-binding protein [Phycisphaerae bacterium]
MNTSTATLILRVPLPPWGVRLVALIACFCLAAPVCAAAITIHDATGRQVVITDTSRIVSIGGAVTEILYALGFDDRVVAVDTTSLYPPRALAEKPNVGYMRQLSPEGVLGLSPSLVLASENAGPKETIAVLEAASIPFVQVPEHFTAEGILDKIRTVAASVGAEKRGACLAAGTSAELQTLTRMRERIKTPMKVLFVLSFIDGRAMVAGRSTAADGIIKLAGGLNAIDGYEGYKIVADEAVVAAKPDVVLAMKRQGLDLSADTIFAHPAFASTPAAARKAFVSMDGLYLLGFGPRTAQAARDLAAALYPSLGQEIASGRSGPPTNCAP